MATTANVTKFTRLAILLPLATNLAKNKIVRVQYFVRGGSVGHRSRGSSKHPSPHLPVDELDSSGVKQGLHCTCRCTCGCRVHKESRLDVDVFEK
ncbi:hypothetical protein TNCV_1026871 [Trichonephila clavipes]|nr:hypothetical protein TNCV_1026871 [Trichonephila clavipes]